MRPLCVLFQLSVTSPKEVCFTLAVPGDGVVCVCVCVCVFALRIRVDSLEKTLMLGRIGGRRRGRQKMRWLDGITDSMDVSLT